MEFANASELYKFVKTHSIKRVLDLGTGIGVSPAVVALAMEHKGETDYHIDSIEQFGKCVKIAKELIPEELQKHLLIYHSPVKIISFPEIPYQYFSTYASLPEGDYDLIINDGPGMFLENGNLIDLPNGTITQMLRDGKLKPGTFIAWDGRIHMLKLLSRFYKDNFEMIPFPGTDLNILVRKDNPPTLRDNALEEIKTLTTYFNEENTFTTNSTPSQSEAVSPNTGTTETL